jgi:YVTN family beta-propeller protein
VHAARLDVFRVRPLERLGGIRTSATPTRVLIAPGGARAYVTNQFAQEVGFIDLLALQQRSAVSVPGDPLGLTLAPDGRRLYVTTNFDRLCVVSLTTSQVVATMPVPLGTQHMTHDPAGRRLYVPCWRAGVVIEADAQTLQVRRRFDVGGEPQDLAVSADGVRLFIANESGWLNVVHLPTGPIDTLAMDGAAVSLSLSPDGAVLYVGLVFDGVVIVVDAHSLRVVGEIRTGGRPRRIAFDQTGSLALIANEMGWIDLIT